MSAPAVREGGLPVRNRHPRWAWVVAAATLVIGPLALRGAFAAGQRSDSLDVSAVFTLASLLLAVIWAGGGAGVIALGGPDTAVKRIARGRAAFAAAVIGGGFALLCLLGGLLLWHLGPTRSWVDGGLQTARSAPWVIVFAVALLAGAGEEVFFRLALPRLLRGVARWVVPILLYAAATAATGNPGLVIVAVPLAIVCQAVWDHTGRWFAPLIVHALWSVAMVGILPLLVG